MGQWVRIDSFYNLVREREYEPELCLTTSRKQYDAIKFWSTVQQVLEPCFRSIGNWRVLIWASTIEKG